jgi:seryl-tRNA synthetase
MGHHASTRTKETTMWLPGQQAYREIPSCSNFEAFQAVLAPYLGGLETIRPA